MEKISQNRAVLLRGAGIDSPLYRTSSGVLPWQLYVFCEVTIGM